MNPFKFSLFVFTAMIVTLLAGCQSRVFNNYTPTLIPQNASGLYTFSFSANIPVGVSVIAGSERAEIVINGETFPMQSVEGSPRTFRFDYRMPAGLAEARYYFILHYDTLQNGVRRTVTRFSTQDAGRIFTAELITRFAIQLVNERGPVGATVALVGNGFTSEDVVVLDGNPAPTVVRSPNSIEFTVPPLPAGRSYAAVVRTPAGDLPVGSFRIDAGRISVRPGNLQLTSGDADMLIFGIDFPAPAGGLRLDVTTDIPSSIIMPEVIIPAGARSVSASVEGGSPGRGSLFVEAPGFAPLTVPVRVD
ncbi:MAG: IPT/TIG domain-containing protein [Verrucomicrobia bacterium]|nr:IPT/TIG domain-containing protein [Verrucomicrobiota bacterium]